MNFIFPAAKRSHFTFTNIRLDFVSHLLKKIGIVNLNAVKKCKHLKPPMWKQKALRLSFKTYSLGDFQLALCEQSAVGLCLSNSFNGTTEVNTDEHQLSGRAALEAAKNKTPAKQPSLQSVIDISNGHGRATRECELIWCPLFDSSSGGMLTLRIFVGKVQL